MPHFTGTVADSFPKIFAVGGNTRLATCIRPKGTTRSFRFMFLVFAILFLPTGCATLEQISCVIHNKEVMPQPFPEQKLRACLGENPITFGPVSHSVFCLGMDNSKPPIVLLHELTGLSAKTLQYAESLSNDFTVYVPMLFGALNQASVIRGNFAFRFNGEWTAQPELDGSTRIVEWLRNVMVKIERNHPGQSIGVIGNCLTGSLPLALLDNAKVKAIVLAQPTLPLPIFRYSEDDRRSLGISATELKNAKNRDDVRLYGVRFEDDCVSFPQKRNTLVAEFGDRFIDAEILECEYLTPEQCAAPNREKIHSTLIGEWGPEKKCNPSESRRKEVREFLKRPVTFKHELPACAAPAGQASPGS